MITDETRGVGEMNREDIDKLWQQALFESVKDGEQFARYHFANLIAAAEREACAEILERNAEVCINNSMLHDTLVGNALAIRARGEK